MKISATFFRVWVLFSLACQLTVVPTLGDDTTERNTIDSTSMTYLVKSNKAKYAHFGHAMANLGPLDSDVIDDIIVSVPFYGNNNEGEMIILYLTASGSWTSYKMISANTFGLNVQNAMIGLALANVGDLDSDGLNDVAFTSNSTSYGEVTLAKFDASGTVQNYVTIPGNALGLASLESIGTRFGTAVEAVGDWDGNGMADLLVGAPGLDGGSIVLVSITSASNGWVELDSGATTLALSSATATNLATWGTEFGTSIAYEPSTNLVLVGAPATSGGGAVWILSLTSTLGVNSAVKIDTSAFGLSDGEGFGTAVVILTNSSAGADYDGDMETLDIAVSSPYAEVDSNDNRGIVYLVCLYPSTGAVSSWYRLAELSAFTSSGWELSSNDRLGQGLAALGALGSKYPTTPDLCVGMPGFSSDSNRAGGILSMQLKPPPAPTTEPTSSLPTTAPVAAPTTSAPTPAPSFSPEPSSVPSPVPTLAPTTPAPTTAPSAMPNPQPTFQPTTSPAPTTADTITVGVSMAFLATGTATDSQSTDLKAVVAAQLNVSLTNIRGWALTSSTSRRLRRLTSSGTTTTWTADFDVVTTSATMTSADLGSKVQTSLTSTAFSTAVAANPSLSAVTVDTSSITTEASTRRPSFPPTLAPSPLPTISFMPTVVPTLSPTSMPTGTSVPSHHPTFGPTWRPSAEPSKVPSSVPTPAPYPEPTAAPVVPPTKAPTKRPTQRPSGSTAKPTYTKAPTGAPTSVPSPKPTRSPPVPGHPTPVPTPEDTEVPGLSVATIFLMTIVWCCVFAFVSMFFYTAQRWFTLCFHRIYRWVAVNILGRQPPLPPIAGVELARAIPSAVYERTACYHRVPKEERDDTCSICLIDMEPDEEVKELNCRHCYHAECLHQWLLVSVLCPLCKQRAEPPTAPRRRPHASRVMDLASTWRVEGRGAAASSAPVVEVEMMAAELPSPVEEHKDGEGIPDVQFDPETGEEIEYVEMSSVVPGFGMQNVNRGGGGRRGRGRGSDDNESADEGDDGCSGTVVFVGASGGGGGSGSGRAAAAAAAGNTTTSHVVSISSSLRQSPRVSPTTTPRVAVARNQVMPDEAPTRLGASNVAVAHQASNSNGVPDALRNLHSAFMSMGLAADRDTAPSTASSTAASTTVVHVATPRPNSVFHNVHVVPIGRRGGRGGRRGRGGRGSGRAGRGGGSNGSESGTGTTTEFEIEAEELS